MSEVLYKSHPIKFLSTTALFAFHQLQGRPTVRAGRLDASTRASFHPEMQAEGVKTMPALQRWARGVVGVVAVDD